MRKITLIVVHCSANQAGSRLRGKDIDREHRARGWNGYGYHYVIPIDGTIETARPEMRIGAHCRNHNRHSIGICYIGGIASDGKTPLDTRTPKQHATLRFLLENLHEAYPSALIVEHQDLNPAKACPYFDVVAEFRDLQS